MIAVNNEHTLLGFECLQRLSPNIFHFVTTRRGGCSEGQYASMNCTHYCGDNPEHVSRNRQMLLDMFPVRPKALLIPRQTHGMEVRCIDRDFVLSGTETQTALLEGVDALVTNQSGCCLCISTADCVPVLLCDPAKGVIAAVHAGWRGTVGGIVGKTVQVMKNVYGCRGEDLLAGIGPSISAASFEVGEEVYQSFRDAGFPMEQIAFRHVETGKWHIDLWEVNRLQLLAGQVAASNIELAGICTLQHPDWFFSARHAGIRSGRMLSGIQLNGFKE